MALKPVKVGVIGSGNISYTYLNTLTSGFSIIDLVGCSDLIPEKSKARSELFGIKQLTTEQILADPEIEIVVNITEIANHAKVTRMALEAGKNVYSEKSAGCNYEEAKANIDFAKSKGLRFGAAPDTYLGAAYQTARKMIDDGWIGDPIGAMAWCIRSGKPWAAAAVPDYTANHFAKGTTMTFDMGGYYMNALVSLLGPVARVAGYAKSWDKGVWENTKNEKFGTPYLGGGGSNNFMATFEFHNGCYANFFVTGAGFGAEVPRVEIWGTKGCLIVPDPNCYGGWGRDLYLCRISQFGTFSGPDEKYRVPFTHGFAETDPSVQPKSGKWEPGYNGWRGIGVVDMAYAIRRQRPHRSSEDLGLHFVEIASAIEDTSASGGAYTVKTKPAHPAPLAPGFIGPVSVMEGAIDNIR